MRETNQKNKRIGIDARFYGPAGKGLGRYTQEIVDNVVLENTNDEFVIFLLQENFELFNTNNPKVKKVLVDVRWYSLAEQIVMPYYIWKEKLDLIHFPHFNVPIFCQTKFVVTIHDLILIHYPTIRASTLGPILYKIKNWAYRLVIWLAIKRSQKIITVSEFTKKDIQKVFTVNPDKIIVTYEGVSGKVLKNEHKIIDDKKVLLGYNIHRPYLLYVGNVYPHKNLEGLLKVFFKIREKKPDFKLVLVGKQDYFYERLQLFAERLNLWQKTKPDNAVFFTGFVPDQELASLYDQAEAYVFPSLYEGFGLPPLEAMAHGLCVVSSNKASMPEILGKAALYFDPTDLDEMFGQILEVINNPELRKKLIADGYENVKRYNWKTCISQTINVYNLIIDRSNK